MPFKIRKVTLKGVEVDPPVKGRTFLQPEKFQVTDPAIGLVEGNEFEQGVPSNFITGFSSEMARDTGPKPEIDRNPYNFVALAGPKPWPAEAVREAGHDRYATAPRNFSGVISFEAEALTPVFVPEGFPFAAADPKPGSGTYETEDLRNISRRFLRMHKLDGQEYYAIPGSSFKGAIRSSIEALTNSRLGIADEKILDQKHVYRRRVFQAGIVSESPNSPDWRVKEIEFPQGGGGSQYIPNKQGLLGSFIAGKSREKAGSPSGKEFTLPAAVVAQYAEQIKHPHYSNHWDNHSENYTDLTAGTWKDSLPLTSGNLIYFTLGPDKRVNTFGKNTYYMWSATRSIIDLAKPFLPRVEGRFDDGHTDTAEFLFGFAVDHKAGENPADPFRGQLRFETVWGPSVEEAKPEPLTLAPLTGPTTHAKSRPLYLTGDPTGVSGSFDDPQPELRGRKFYWHQRFDDPKQAIWPKHTFGGNRPVDAEFRREVFRQCPPRMETLPKTTKFQGKIHFTNLTPAELGALIYALEGERSLGAANRYDHAFHIGKAKSRGLGSMRLEVTAINVHMMTKRYDSLTKPAGEGNLAPKKSVLLDQFKGWSVARCKKQGAQPQPFDQLGHIRDYDRLHTWQKQSSIRYYPVNFNQYNWMPADNDSGGEPRGPARGQAGKQFRPPAMKRARDIQP